MKKKFLLLGLLLVLALTGCGSANKTKDADKTADKAKDTKSVEEKSTKKVDVFKGSKDHHNFKKGEFPYTGKAKTVTMKIFYDDTESAITYDVRVKLNPEVYMISEFVDKDREGDYELSAFIDKFGNNINGINFIRKGDPSRTYKNRFSIRHMPKSMGKDFNMLDFLHENDKKHSDLDITDIYTLKDGKRVYSYMPKKTPAKDRHFNLYLELGNYGVLELYFDEDIDPKMQEQLTKDMAEYIEIASPKK